MSLKEYKAKRKFGATPEPGPEKGTAPDLRVERSESVESVLSPHAHEARPLVFVVHKHAARALHYDLRLELRGVLKSWAVPKGPSLDPSVKRLAVMVEDHPLDYKDFEGVIPEGNYGAGNVIIWDRGVFIHPSAGDREESEKLLMDGLKKGNLKFVLAGEKLQGDFALVKAGRDDKSWLLMKKKDRYATKEDVLKKNRSVASKRTLEEISEAGQRKAPAQKIDRIHLVEALESEDLVNAPVKPMPHGVRPMLATLVKGPFDNPDWVFEVKWDGYRAIAQIHEGKVSIHSRNLISLGKKFYPVVESLEKLCFDAIFDGEIVVVDDQGRPDFQMLQNYQKSGRGNLVYCIFDLLYLEGHDLTKLPLLRRKDLLRRIVPTDPRIRFSEHVLEEGVAFFNAVREKGLEGLVAKYSRSAYRMGKRSRQWLKVKTQLTQEGVIAGFTAPRGGRGYFGSLVLGVYEKDELAYIGHCGGGFTGKKLRDIHSKLTPLVRKGCPFKAEPETNTPVTWVKPELVCEVVFHGWTDEGLMRQPVFLRLRADKEAREVVREK
ncbi:MAG TPA: non-homologous end-joining DNA ligase [Thermodesulfovibrionales bacterium]|nr:non-homologous end-joining DNA ligase [Thermodesulfovibrionales bacterium]